MYNLKAQSLVFKGYRKGKEGKKPADNKLYKYEEISGDDCYGGQCADNIIDVSFDDIALFDQVLNIIEETDLSTYALYSPHGGHTYWRYDKEIKNGHDLILACGIKADVHNKGTYIPLKVDGKERTEVYDDITSIPELPAWLRPLPNKCGIDLWQMKEGEGRNDSLSKHVFALGKIKMEETQIKDVFSIINKYILADPIDKNELNTILRPETFEKISTTSFFDDNGKFLPNEFGKYIIEEYNTIYTNGQLCVYNETRGFYDSSIRLIKRLMINMIGGITKSRREEVYDYLTIMSNEKEQSNRRYILFNNGVYDLTTQTLLPHSPDYIISNQIPWDYNPNAYSELVDKTLDKLSCYDKDVRTQLEECIGYCFYRDNKLGKCFVFTGEKNNGKSTFIFMLNNLLGDDNYCSVDINNLSREYDVATLSNKLANIKDDISDGYMEGLNISLFKQIVTGNRCRGRFIYQDPFDFYPYATLIFSANNMPRMKDPTGAVIKRLILIPFNAVFTKDDPDFDPQINDKLCLPECMEYLIKLGVEALIKVIDRNGFTISGASRNETNEYKTSNDSVLSFISEVGIEEILNQSSNDVYARYEVFCAEEGSKPVRKSEMHKRIKSELGYKLSDPCKINNKTIRVYVEN